MDEKERDYVTPIVVGLGSVLIVGAALNYIHVLSVRRKKLKKIEEWKLENLACIRNSRDRLIAMTEAPDFKSTDFLAALNEEVKFLDLVRDQPMI